MNFFTDATVTGMAALLHMLQAKTTSAKSIQSFNLYVASIHRLFRPQPASAAGRQGHPSTYDLIGCSGWRIALLQMQQDWMSLGVRRAGMRME